MFKLIIKTLVDDIFDIFSSLTSVLSVLISAMCIAIYFDPRLLWAKDYIFYILMFNNFLLVIRFNAYRISSKLFNEAFIRLIAVTEKFKMIIKKQEDTIASLKEGKE